jgi:hypothetical protein
MEPDEAGDGFSIRLDDEALGVSHAHGTRVVWFAS